MKKATLSDLVKHLAGNNPVIRLHSQREILRRGQKAQTTQALVQPASDAKSSLSGRVAALFTLKQLDGKDSHKSLVKFVEDESIREFALRALTDRKSECKYIDTKLFVTALADKSARVRAQATISLARLGDVSVARNIIPLTSRPKGSVLPTQRPVHAQPDPDRVVTHLASRALVSLKAVDACLEAIDGSHREGALRAMRSIHDEKVVDGLIRKLGTARSPELRQEILVTLIRLYHCEADYKGTWWGIRPDNSGPYYDRQEWSASKRIGTVVTESADAVLLREATGVRRELKQKEIESRKKQDQSMMPEGLGDNLTPEQLADLIAYLVSLR